MPRAGKRMAGSQQQPADDGFIVDVLLRASVCIWAAQACPVHGHAFGGQNHACLRWHVCNVPDAASLHARRSGLWDGHAGGGGAAVHQPLFGARSTGLVRYRGVLHEPRVGVSVCAAGDEAHCVQGGNVAADAGLQLREGWFLVHFFIQ